LKNNSKRMKRKRKKLLKKIYVLAFSNSEDSNTISNNQWISIEEQIHFKQHIITSLDLI
jgi:hypothetical protein